MSEAERVKELNRLYLKRLEQYKEAAAKRDNLYITVPMSMELMLFHGLSLILAVILIPFLSIP